MQRGGNGSVLQIQRYYFIWQLASLLMQIVSPDGRQPLDRRYTKFAVGWGPKVSVQITAVDMTCFLRLADTNDLFTAHRCFSGEASGQETTNSICHTK